MPQGEVLVPLLEASQKTKLHNSHADTEGLSWSQAGSLVVGSISVSLYEPRLVGSVGFLVMS